MAFHKAKRKFGREKNQRVALMKSLVLALATEEKIKTTEAKAKELRPFIEKLVTLGKKAGTGGAQSQMAARRLIESRVGRIAAAKIVKDLSPRYKERAGGYTRITKMVRRASDGAPMAYIEFV